MGNGTGLPIRSTGSSLLCSPTSFFVLENLLHVPDITKNLLSVNLLLIMKSFLNFILTLILSRISLPRKLYCGDDLRMACMSSPWGTIASPSLPRLFSVSVHHPPSGMSALAIPTPELSVVLYLSIGFLSSLTAGIPLCIPCQ